MQDWKGPYIDWQSPLGLGKLLHRRHRQQVGWISSKNMTFVHMHTYMSIYPYKYDILYMYICMCVNIQTYASTFPALAGSLSRPSAGPGVGPFSVAQSRSTEDLSAILGDTTQWKKAQREQHLLDTMCQNKQALHPLKRDQKRAEPLCFNHAPRGGPNPG